MLAGDLWHQAVASCGRLDLTAWGTTLNNEGGFLSQ